MHEMRRLGIVPIIDLVHFGLPDWLGNFQNPSGPQRFADYAHRFAERYPWVRYYTPVNEIYVTALFSARSAGGTSGSSATSGSSPTSSTASRRRSGHAGDPRPAARRDLHLQREHRVRSPRQPDTSSRPTS
jgi:hypothetical protein